MRLDQSLAQLRVVRIPFYRPDGVDASIKHAALNTATTGKKDTCCSFSSQHILVRFRSVAIALLTLPWLKPLGFLRHCGLNILVAKVPRLTAFAARAR